MACLLALVWTAHAQESRVYVRNRPVQGRALGGEVYVDFAQLATYFAPAELSRIRYDETLQHVSVEGQSIPAPGGQVPVGAVAQALGFSKRLHNGIVDWVALSNAPDTARSDSMRRSEYAESAHRLEKILRVLPPVAHPVWTERIARIGRKVADASPLRHLEWKFVLVEDSSPNAACVGEGHVFVTTGLLMLGVTDDELAGVLGHEIAHGVRRHVFKRVELMRDLTRLLNDYQRLSHQLQTADSGSLASLRSQVNDYEKRRETLQYRLDHDIFYNHLDEEEADVVGLRYAVMAGYSPEGLGSCLIKLERHSIAQFGTAVLRDDMSHPPVRRRLEILQKARQNGRF